MQRSKLKFKMQNFISPFLIIGIAVVLRLIPHPANVAPITAMALFGGAYLNKKYALIVPLLAMFISDIFLGFHNTMPFVYGSFLIAGLIGLWLRERINPKTVILASLLSSVIFFVITNFGVWLVGNLYPKTFAGLVECYALAIPFFRNTIIGDLFYVGLFFGSYNVILNLIQNLVSDNTRLRIPTSPRLRWARQVRHDKKNKYEDLH